MTTHSVPPHHQSKVHGDEITLVDLAKILIKRWKAILITFLIVVTGALAYVLLQERTYQYVSLYHLAEQGGGGAPTGLESPNSIIAKIQNLYLGPAVRELIQSSNLERLPFEINANNPIDTLLVRLESNTSESNSELVAELHEYLLQRAMDDQQSLVEHSRERLERRLARAELALETAEQREASGELLATQMNRIAEIETRLAQLNEGRVVQVAVQSLEPTGTSRTLILALAIVMGGILALMVAFMLHFSSIVRLSLQEGSR
ncbi:Wzz/FepE/Etk N-terminal domain-containing protein [Billgrantia sp. LNSP4103-1]|uniref:Wzz/FepE/Etk N-terminal domain-containing protein n=1 Tax=Billgrantia sp. LNSP4103-1 TaxID=3410266 RepID=UPI00403F0E56